MDASATSGVTSETRHRATIDQAFAECERYTKSRVENFAVGSLLIKRPLRRHFYSIYAFCRGVDDIGDEAEGDRIELLAKWESELDLCYRGTPTKTCFIALQHTIIEFGIERDPFKRLIEANLRDQFINRYPDYPSLLDYCEHSANPVGHLVLSLMGIKDLESRCLSDYTCTALQLTNFYQDVTRDYKIGRIYLPQDELRRFGVDESEIAGGIVSDRFRRLMKFQVDRARRMFESGYPLIEKLPSRAKLEFAMFNAAGLAVLDKIEAQGMDTLSSRPTLSRAKMSQIIFRILARGVFGINPLPKVKYSDTIDE